MEKLFERLINKLGRKPVKKFDPIILPSEKKVIIELERGLFMVYAAKERARITDFLWSWSVHGTGAEVREHCLVFVMNSLNKEMILKDIIEEGYIIEYIQR